MAWAPPTPAARAAMFARISASRAPGAAVTAFCSANAHALLCPPRIERALLGFLTHRTMLPLRATCKRARIMHMFARISASRAPGTALSAACGGADAHTLLSPHSVQHALLGFLDARAALPLRTTCREARAAVAGHAWKDRDTWKHCGVARVLPPRALRQCEPGPGILCL